MIIWQAAFVSRDFMGLQQRAPPHSSRQGGHAWTSSGACICARPATRRMSLPYIWLRWVSLDSRCRTPTLCLPDAVTFQQ